MVKPWRATPALLVLLLACFFMQATAYWCYDWSPYMSKDFGSYLPQGPPPAAAVPLMSRPLLHNETLSPTCGTASFYSSVMDVKAFRAEHLGSNVWTLLNSAPGYYLRAVDIEITNVDGVMYAHQVGAWYVDMQSGKPSAFAFPATDDLTLAQVKDAYYNHSSSIGIKTASSNGYALNKLAFDIQVQSSGHTCDVRGRYLTNLTDGCEAITDEKACTRSYTTHNGIPIPCAVTPRGAMGNCTARSSCASSGSLPKTIDWNPQALVDMPELLSRAHPPQVRPTDIVYS